MADIIRNVPYFGTSANPFFGAEAIYIDGGGSFVGAERDAGIFFILVGKEKGTFKSFDEIAGGIAPDAGFGLEIGRVDVSGDPNKFTSEYLYGLRRKAWLSVSPTGEFTSVGGAFSWSTVEGVKVSTTAIQFGLGVGPLPFILGGGYNFGEIRD